MVENMEFVLFAIAIACGYGAITLSKKQKKQKIQELKATENNRVSDSTTYFETWVTGVEYQMNNVHELFDEMKENDDLVINDEYKETDEIGDDRIYKFDSVSLYCRMVPEPTNEQDKNAIRVEVSRDGLNWYHVGYVPRRDIESVRNGIEKGVAFRCEWNGDRFKTRNEDDEIIEKEHHYFEVDWRC